MYILICMYTVMLCLLTAKLWQVLCNTDINDWKWLHLWSEWWKGISHCKFSL